VCRFAYSPPPSRGHQDPFRPALPCGLPLVLSTASPSSTTWMNEIHSRNVGSIKWWRLGSLGSMGPLNRSLNRCNCHPEAIQGVPEHSRCITQHGGGPAAPRGPAAPINLCVERNQPMEPTYNHLRSSDQGRPRREAAHHSADRTY
jgi:hypothetical protein